jgi:hypothetical protein
VEGRSGSRLVFRFAGKSAHFGAFRAMARRTGPRAFGLVRQHMFPRVHHADGRDRPVVKLYRHVFSPDACSCSTRSRRRSAIEARPCPRRWRDSRSARLHPFDLGFVPLADGTTVERQGRTPLSPSHAPTQCCLRRAPDGASSALEGWASRRCRPMRFITDPPRVGCSVVAAIAAPSFFGRGSRGCASISGPAYTGWAAAAAQNQSWILARSLGSWRDRPLCAAGDRNGQRRGTE